MEISYKVKVLEVGTDSLTVEFSSPGLKTRIVGTPLVPADISQSSFFRQYAPFREWVDELTPKQTLVTGQEINDTVSFEEPQKQQQPTLTLTADSL